MSRPTAGWRRRQWWRSAHPDIRAWLSTRSQQEGQGTPGLLRRASTAIPVMEPADLGQLDHLADLRRLYVPVFRAILGQRQMRAGPGVVVEVALENPAKVALPEDNNVIQAIPPVTCYIWQRWRR